MINELIRKFKLSVVVLQSNITSLKKDSYNTGAVISAEVGETVEDKEIKKLERIWTKEWVCPVCGKLEGNAVFTQKIEIVDGKAIEHKESSAQKMIRGEMPPTDIITSKTARPEFSFDTKEEFDAHMKNVHGMDVDADFKDIKDEEILKDYGAHYLDMRYGHEIIAGPGDGNKVVIRPRHHDFVVDDIFYSGAMKIINLPDKTKIKKRKMDILKKPSE